MQLVRLEIPGGKGCAGQDHSLSASSRKIWRARWVPGQRQFNHKTASLSGNALSGEGTAHHFHQGSANRQSDTVALYIVGPVYVREYPLRCP